MEERTGNHTRSLKLLTNTNKMSNSNFYMHTKICLNPACKVSFETKNPKKRFCTLRCKNQAAYRYRLTVYEWETRMLKMRRKNIKILEHLILHKIFRIGQKELTALGFDFHCAFIPDSSTAGFRVYRFGKIYMEQIMKTEFTLETIK